MASKVAIEFFHKLAFGLGDDAPSPASPKPSGQLSAKPAATPTLPAAPAAKQQSTAATPAANPAAPTPAQTHLKQQQAYAAPINDRNDFWQATANNVEQTGAGSTLSDVGSGIANFGGMLGNGLKSVALHAASVPMAIGGMLTTSDKDIAEARADYARHPTDVPYTSPLSAVNTHELAKGAWRDAQNSAGALWSLTYPRHERQATNSNDANTLAAQYGQIGLSPQPVAAASEVGRNGADAALGLLTTTGPAAVAKVPYLTGALSKLPAVSRAIAPVRASSQVRPGLQQLGAKAMAPLLPVGVANSPRSYQNLTQSSADVANELVSNAENDVVAEQQRLADAPEPAPPPELANISQGINATKGPDGKVPHGPPSPILSQPTAAAKDLVTKNPPEAKAQAEAAKARVEETLAKNKTLAAEAASWAKTGEVGQNTLNGAYSAVSKMVQDPSQIMPTLQNLSTPEMLGLGLGLGAGALGLMNLLGGKGGLGSMLMMLLGGGAAIAALGNNASGGQLGNYLGGMGADLSGAFNIYTASPDSPEYAKQVAETAMTMPAVQSALPGIQKKLDKSNAGVGGAIASATGGRAPLLGWAAQQAQSGINSLTGGDVGGINAAIKTETQRQAREELLPYMPWLKDKPELLDNVFKELVAKGGLQAKYL
jgi:hypothetical protein